ncbi:hypothetical protein Enr13x_76660 [Stieleria neptunia]|uniref:Major facilitator superfamily (MFS) profile domain-containing protein n=1 Tax=Stieleria neptunia TaxID=2527979 RepID=A0A518I3V6_9BACT|nr:hypothetical protein [Stieleria neptunia]QDV47754.1 hypothetical protein Enr13x_76660 [Stieleria neptunia]
MQFDITSLIVGGLVGALVGVALAVPRVGRILACVISVVLFTAGAGCLIWASSALISGEELRPLDWHQLYIASAAEALGVGGGLLIGGILVLVLALALGGKGVSRRL